ncbi:MAG: palindromic element RPE4 domain-containing protein [Rickettsia endosymbiont of Graphium doson]|nr:palindromic element RPE4 domain-containing protein [Rickettsia endosymbiont of Graphium doson]
MKRDKSSFLYLYFLLDPVVKPRDDYLRAFFDPRWQCRHGMTPQIL